MPDIKPTARGGGGGGGGGQPLPVGQAFRLTAHWTEATGDQTTTPSVEIVRYYQVYVPSAVTILSIEIRPTVTTGASMELGIYADSSGVPGARLAKTAVTPLDPLGSGTHRIPLESSILLQPGWYWMAFVPTLDGPTMRGFMSFTEDGIQVDGVRAQTSQATLPATAASAATGSNVVLHLYLVSIL